MEFRLLSTKQSQYSYEMLLFSFLPSLEMPSIQRCFTFLL